MSDCESDDNRSAFKNIQKKKDIKKPDKKKVNKDKDRDEDIEVPKQIKKEIQEIVKQEAKIEKQYASRDEITEKAKLIYSIKSYGNNPRLGLYLKQAGHNFTESFLKSLTLDELRLELEKQDIALGQKQNNGLIDTTIKNGLLFAENMISSKTNFKIQGTCEKCFEDDHFLDTLERVKMRYNMPMIKMDPALELALVIAQTATIINKSNQFMQDIPRSTTNLDAKLVAVDL